METELYVVTGATGNIGKKVAEGLLAKGKKARVVGRNQKNLEPLVRKGAEAFVGDVQDPATVQKAFTGAKAVFLLIPPNFQSEKFRAYYNNVSESYAQAIRETGVRYAVSISSVGAQLADKNGPIGGLHDNEQRLNKIEGLNIVHLRPAFFMENFLQNVGLIKQKGIAGTPLKADLPIAMIATKDIAAKAVELLTHLDFKGKSVLELLGNKDVTMNEAVRALGQAIGKGGLPYVQFPYEDAQKAMTSMGISQDLARLFIEMYKGFNDGIVIPTEKRSAKNTTPTSIEEYAKEFAQVYNAN